MIIEISDGAIFKLIYLVDSKYKSKQILIVCGKTNSKKVAKYISTSIVSDNTINVVDSIKSTNIFPQNINGNSVILGVGGGKLMDISKEVAYQHNLDLILFPTVISNDGLANGLVVLNSVNNGQSIYRKTADYIFVDFKIINSAPQEFLKSAIGDVFSNFSAINDFIENTPNNTKVSLEAKQAVFSSLDILTHQHKPNIKTVVKSIVASGKSVELLKNSSAISGSEHLILHSLECLYPNKSVNHGIAVASISLFTLHLQGKLQKSHIEFLHQNKISLDFTQLFRISTDDLKRVFDLAKSYRPSRKTILNKFDNKELIKQIIQLEKKTQNLLSLP